MLCNKNFHHHFYKPTSSNPKEHQSSQSLHPNLFN